MFESSTREKTPARRSFEAAKVKDQFDTIEGLYGSRYAQTSWTRGANSSLALKGTIRTLVGATTGGSDKTYSVGNISYVIGEEKTKAYTTFNILFSAPETVF